MKGREKRKEKKKRGKAGVTKEKIQTQVKEKIEQHNFPIQCGAVQRALLRKTKYFAMLHPHER